MSRPYRIKLLRAGGVPYHPVGIRGGSSCGHSDSVGCQLLVQVVAVRGTRRTWELSFLRVMRQTGTATSLTLTNLTARLRTLTPRRSCPTRRRSSSNTAGYIRLRRSQGLRSSFILESHARPGRVTG